jgi:hypothetical protein
VEVAVPGGAVFPVVLPPIEFCPALYTWPPPDALQPVAFPETVEPVNRKSAFEPCAATPIPLLTTVVSETVTLAKPFERTPAVPLLATRLLRIVIFAAPLAPNTTTPFRLFATCTSFIVPLLEAEL